MRNLRFIFILAFTMVATLLRAQDETCINAIANLRAIKLVGLEGYAYYSDLSSGARANSFYKLFTDDATVVNDILPANQLDTKVKPDIKSYREPFGQYYNTNTYKQDVRVIGIKSSNIDKVSGGIVEVVAEKIISGQAKNSKVVYSDTLTLVFEVQVTPRPDSTDKNKNPIKNGKYLIRSIRHEGNLGKYAVVTAQVKKWGGGTKPLKNQAVIVNDKKSIKLNKDGYFLLRRLKPETQISFKIEDEIAFSKRKYAVSRIGVPTKPVPEEQGTKAEKEKRETILNNRYYQKGALLSDPNELNVRFRPSVLFVGIEGGFANASLVSVSFNAFENQIIFSNLQNYKGGITIGLKLFQTPNYYFALKTSANFGSTKFNLQLPSSSESYNATDPDKGSYIRTNKVSNLTENVEFNHLSIPVVLEYAQKLKKGAGGKLWIYGSAGIEYGILGQGSSSVSAQMHYSGNYPELFNITFAENGVYDFGKYEKSAESELKVAKGFLVGRATVGGMYKFSKRLSVRLGATYATYLTEPFVNEGLSISRNRTELNSTLQFSNKINFNYIRPEIGVYLNL